MKHLLKIGLIPTILSVCLDCFGQLPAQNGDPCANAYQGALSNIDSSQRVQVANSIAYSKYCSASGQFDKDNFGLQVSAIVYSIPFTVGLTNESDEQKMENFCKEGFAQNGFYSNDIHYAKTSADEAQQNFNQCRLFETSGLAVTHTYAAPKFVVFYGHYLDKNTVASLDRVSFDTTLVKCSTTSFGNGRPLSFSATTPRMNAQNDFTIQCERIPDNKKYLGEDFYPATAIVVSISKAGASGIYSVSAPEEAALGPALSSDASSQIADLNKQVIDANNAKASALAQRDAATQKLNNANVTSALPFSKGDRNFGWPGPRIDPRDNIDLQGWLAAQCGPNLIAKYFELGSGSGGCCGFSTYIGTCLSKQ